MRRYSDIELYIVRATLKSLNGKSFLVILSARMRTGVLLS